MALTPRQVIDMVNDVSQVKIPTNYNVTFGDTESADVTGSNEKDFVVGDKLIIFSHPDVSEEDVQKTIEKLTPVIKLILEFQSKAYYDKHYTMGLRLFSYTINSAERTKVNGEIVFDIPEGITFYMDRYLPKYGEDILTLRFPFFWGADTKYSGAENEFFRVKYNYVNLLAFKKDDFKGTPFEILEVLYMYRYRKNIDLMLTEDFINIMKDIAYKIMQYEGRVLELLSKMYQDLIYDIGLKAETNTEKYGKVLEGMVEVKKSYGTKLIDDAMAVGEARGEARGEAKAALSTKLTMAKKMLVKDSVEYVADFFELPIEYVQEIEEGNTVEAVMNKYFRS